MRDNMKYLDVFGRLCGDNAVEHVRLVTTMWGKVKDRNSAENRVQQLEGTFWKPLIDEGARHRRFENTHDSAWKIIHDATGDSEALLLQEEMVDCGRRLHETTAAKGLYLQKQKEIFKQLSHEPMAQQDPALTKELEEECERIDAQLQMTWEGRLKLKKPWLKIPFLSRPALSKKGTHLVSILCWMYLMETHF